MPTTTRKLILAGGSGFLGQQLAEWFTERDWNVVVLTRDVGHRTPHARSVTWDAKTLGAWAAELDGATALVNLTGRSVNCRYHARNRELILSSRIDSTRVLGQAVACCEQPPREWLNSSTATIYKHSFDRPMDELTGVIASSPEAHDQFSVDVAQAWEQAFDEAAAPRTRKVALRTAIVLGTAPGTAYRILRRLIRCGLGGSITGGQQYMSWLHETDFCRAVEWLIDRDDLAGPINLAAPEPVTNRQFMRTLRTACGMPFGLPAARWMLEMGTLLLRSQAELVIKSRRVVPTRLTAAGFTFRFANLTAAIDDLEQRLARDSKSGG
jgi:hypothetical protein